MHNERIMKKMLSIIIPYYEETTHELLPILTIIQNQVGIDLNSVEIILVNDGNKNKLSQCFFKEFILLDVKIITMKENRGPGIARQTGLDAAKGKYVTFCDADDTFHNVMTLAMLLNELSTHQPDILITSWLEEQKCPDGWIYSEHKDDRTWMFGKVFDVQFLRGNNIRFHEELRVQEDSYFNSLACECARSVRVIDAITYIWKYREKSITRKDDYSYSFWSFSEYIKSATLAIKELDERGLVQNLPHKITQLIMYAFFVLHQGGWLKDEVAEYHQTSEAVLVERIQPYLHYFTNLPDALVKEIYSIERERTYKNEMETEFFHNWLQRIGLSRKE